MENALLCNWVDVALHGYQARRSIGKESPNQTLKDNRERERYAWLQETKAETAVWPYTCICDFVLYKARYQVMFALSMRLSSSP